MNSGVEGLCKIGGRVLVDQVSESTAAELVDVPDIPTITRHQFDHRQLAWTFSSGRYTSDHTPPSSRTKIS